MVQTENVEEKDFQTIDERGSPDSPARKLSPLHLAKSLTRVLPIRTTACLGAGQNWAQLIQ